MSQPATLPTASQTQGSSPSSSNGPLALLTFLLSSNSPTFFQNLYTSESLCLGLFRILPPLSRVLVMSMLWMSSEVKGKDVRLLSGLEGSIGQGTGGKGDEVIATIHPLLHSLLILQTIKRKGTTYYVLHEGFKRGLRGAVTGGGTSNSFGATYIPKSGDGSIEADYEVLMDHGDQKWESLLKYMVSSSSRASEGSEVPDRTVLDLLVKSELMGYLVDDRGRQTSLLQITSKGFQFLLEERSTQIWDVLMNYVKQGIAERRNEDGVEGLKLIFTLSNMQLGRAYDASRLPPAQRDILDDMEAYGLIYERPLKNGKKHPQFYPTRLATTLCSGAASNETGHATVGEGRRGFLILETNFKIYAYTSNELEIAILNLFIDIKTRYPNLIVGRLERDTVKKAMSEGITANQIISYLTTHAHPQMLRNDPLLPITVVDQLHLWDRERNRLETEPVTMFKLFRQDLYEDCVSYAKTIAAFAYTSSSNSTIIGEERAFIGRVLVFASLEGPFRTYVESRRREIMDSRMDTGY